jgi:hypothetical protein
MNNPRDYFDSSVSSLTQSLDKNTEWLDNSTIANLITLGLVIYAALFVGKLWPKGMDLFKHPLVKIMSFLAVAYLARKNTALAFVATIAIVTIMMTNLKNTKEFLTVIPARLNTDDNVYEAMLGNCLCRCEGRNCSCKCIEEEPENININDDINNVNVEDEQLLLPQEIFAEQEQNQNQLQRFIPISVPIPDLIVSQLPQVVPQIKSVLPPKTSDIVDERDLISQANKIALDKVKRQIIDHEMEKDKRRVVTTYVDGCEKSPYRRETTPFGQPNFLDEALSYTTLDADYAPVNFN